jgi:nitrate/nitrite transporter NarK
MNKISWLPVIGMSVGMVLGIVGAFGGLGAFLLVVVLGAVGLLVGRLMEGGEVNLSNLTVRRR